MLRQSEGAVNDRGILDMANEKERDAPREYVAWRERVSTPR